MKLANLGVRFTVDDEPAEAPSPNRPTKLYFSGRPSYVLSSSTWGFVLDPEDDMLSHLLVTGSPAPFKRRDLRPVIVDCPGFSRLPAIKKLLAIRDALAARISAEQSAFIAGAINWWVDQVLEKDSQSP